MPKRTRSVSALSAVLTTTSLLLVAAPASAGGFAVARFGGEHGHPLTSNPTAIYYNPAALTESDGYKIFLDGTLGIRSLEFQKTDSVDGAGEPIAPNNGNGAINGVAVSPMIGASAKWGNFALGLGFYVPFGGTGIWEKNDEWEGNTQYPGAYDGVQRWYAIEGTIQSSFITLAAAYEIPKTGLSLGLSGNLIQSKINTIRARAADGTDDVGSENRSLVDVSGTQFSLGLGATYVAVPDKVWLAFSYQSRPNFASEFALTGILKGTGGLPEGDIDIITSLPDVFRFGTRFMFTPQLEARLFGDYTRWSVLERMCLVKAGTECKLNEDGSDATGNGTVYQNQPRNWVDTFGVRAGLSYWLSGQPEHAEHADRAGGGKHRNGGDGQGQHGHKGRHAARDIEIFGGLGYDSSAVPDEALEPALPDFNKVTAGLGARIGIGSHLHAALSYTHIMYMDRDTRGLSTLDEYKGASQNPDSGGEYAQTVGVVNANIEAAF
jgi:long-chain fatty acid transport protein